MLLTCRDSLSWTAREDTIGAEIKIGLCVEMLVEELSLEEEKEKFWFIMESEEKR